MSDYPYQLTDLDKAFEAVLMWKADRMRKNANRIRELQVGVLNRGASRETLESAVLASIDAMIFDLASLVGFTTARKEHADWADLRTRKAFLKKWQQKHNGVVYVPARF